MPILDLNEGTRLHRAYQALRKWVEDGVPTDFLAVEVAIKPAQCDDARAIRGAIIQAIAERFPEIAARAAEILWREACNALSRNARAFAELRDRLKKDEGR